MPEAWIVEAVRSPIGKHGGALASVRPDDLLAHVLSALMERSGVPKEEVEDVYAGCANQAGEDNRNVARMALLLAGFPVEVAGCTVNRLCGSGLEAVAQAARAIWAGEGQVYVGGGVESMSRAPYAVPKPERGFPTGNLTMYDTTLGWRFVNPRIEALYGTESMGKPPRTWRKYTGSPGRSRTASPSSPIRRRCGPGTRGASWTRWSRCR
jgi:acetyl-CoA acyltransferase